MRYSSLFLITCLFTALPSITLASDANIAFVSASFNNHTISENSNLSLSIDTTAAILSGSTITFAITDVGPTSSSSTLTSTASFADVAIAGGAITPYVSLGTSPVAAQMVLNVNSAIAAGSGSTLQVTGIHNPTVAGCYYIAATSATTPTAASNWVYSSNTVAFGVDENICMGNDIGGPADDSDSTPLGALTNVAISSYGDLVHLSWDAYSTDVDSYAIYYGKDAAQVLSHADGGEPDLIVGTRTSMSLLGLDLSSTYYFIITAIEATGQPIAANAEFAPVSTTTGTTTLASKSTARPVLKKKPRGKKTLRVKWTKAFNTITATPTHWVLDLHKKGGKRVKRYKQILPAKQVKKLTTLKPDTAYKIRIRAKYNDVYNLNTAKWVTVKTAYSNYSKARRTKAVAVKK